MLFLLQTLKKIVTGNEATAHLRLQVCNILATWSGKYTYYPSIVLDMLRNTYYNYSQNYASIIYQGLLISCLTHCCMIAKTNHLENTLTSPLLDNGIHLSVFNCKERLQNDHNCIHFELWTMERKQLHTFLQLSILEPSTAVVLR